MTMTTTTTTATTTTRVISQRHSAGSGTRFEGPRRQCVRKLGYPYLCMHGNGGGLQNRGILTAVGIETCVTGTVKQVLSHDFSTEFTAVSRVVGSKSTGVSCVVTAKYPGPGGVCMFVDSVPLVVITAPATALVTMCKYDITVEPNTLPHKQHWTPIILIFRIIKTIAAHTGILLVWWYLPIIVQQRE